MKEAQKPEALTKEKEYKCGKEETKIRGQMELQNKNFD